MNLKIISVLLIINVLLIASTECFPIYGNTLKKLLVPVAVVRSAYRFAEYGAKLKESENTFKHLFGKDFGRDNDWHWGKGGGGGHKGILTLKLDKEHDWWF